MKRRLHTPRPFSIGEIMDRAYAQALRLTSDSRSDLFEELGASS